MLPVEVQKLVDEEKNQCRARQALLSLKIGDDQIEIANKIIDEDMSVRSTEKLVEHLKKQPLKKDSVTKKSLPA